MTKYSNTKQRLHSGVVNLKRGSNSSLALMEGILVWSYFFCLSSVPYLDQEEIKGLRSWHLRSYTLSLKDLCEKYNQEHLVPASGSPFACMAAGRLGLPYVFRLSRLVCLLLFTFVLVLTFCSVEHAFQFDFIASSLAIVFIPALNCVCLHTSV